MNDYPDICFPPIDHPVNGTVWLKGLPPERVRLEKPKVVKVGENLFDVTFKFTVLPPDPGERRRSDRDQPDPTDLDMNRR